MGAAMRVDAPPADMAALREGLGRIAAEEPRAFAALFAPDGARHPVRLGARDLASLLRSFGLVADEGGELRGTTRIRRHGGRFYVMGLGEPHQDVWPETDDLLAVLAASPPGRLLDLGTGTGIIAIEAAAAGYRVVATDIDAGALALARFNAALNGVRVELRRGHLCQPVGGDTFDLILTAPHYTRVYDQLRLETIRSGPALLAEGGRLVVATMLEWEGAGPPAVVGAVLAPLAATGFDVAVSPLRAEGKCDWFAAARASETIPGLVCRHRFRVEIARGAGRVSVTMPDDPPRRDYVPLARVGRRGTAVVTTRDDLGRLERLLAELASGWAEIPPAAHDGVLDGCRFGWRRCVAPTIAEGAAGAILDADGGVRPCSHGRPLARAEDGLAAVWERWRAAAAAAEARRGCASCSASAVCSRCLFPHVLDEIGYCDWVRRHAAELPLLRRLLDALGRLGAVGGPITVKRRFGARPAGDERTRAVAAAWASLDTWILRAGEARAFLLFGSGAVAAVSRHVAAVGEICADGGDMTAYLRAEGLPGDEPLRELERLLATLPARPAAQAQ